MTTPNGNSYRDQNGRAPARPQLEQGTRSKITFDPPRVPVILTPEAIPANPVPGRNGPQFQWLFQGHQIAWFDPDFHAELCACLEVSNCRDLAITKHVQRGQPPRFTVQGVADETEPQQPGGFDPPQPPPVPRRPTPAQTAARRIDEIKRSQAKPSRVWPTVEAAEAETAPPCNAMSQALMEAMLAVHEVLAIATAHGMPWKPSSEDIRALAITIYIHSNGGKK